MKGGGMNYSIKITKKKNRDSKCAISVLLKTAKIRINYL
jgi:hypothetical protein